MGLFGAVKDAKFSEGGVYLGEGVYRLKVASCKQIKTRAKGDACVVEFVVLSSTNPKHGVGSAVSWMVVMSNEPALGNIKQFIATALADFGRANGVSNMMDAIDEATCEAVFSDKSPVVGKIIRAVGNNIKTKKGGDFTKIKFLEDSVGDAGAAEAHASN